MATPDAMESFFRRIEDRFDALERKIDTLARSRHKSMEWIGMLSEHIRSLDDFREEVRASFEPLRLKLESLDDVQRILRHATGDVSRRLEEIETTGQKKAG